MAVAVVPVISVAVSLAAGAIKMYIETVRKRRESEYNQNLSNAVDRILDENEQRLKLAAFDAVVYELKDQIDSFREYKRQYKNDLTRLNDEAKIFQRKISVLMKKLSNAMFREFVSLETLRVWAEAARFHISMTSAGTQTSESLQSLVEIHRETAEKLCFQYRTSNPLSTYSEIHDIKMVIEDAAVWLSNDVNTSGAAGPASQEGQAPGTSLCDLPSRQETMEDELEEVEPELDARFNDRQRVHERRARTRLNDDHELQTRPERGRLAGKEEFEVETEDESKRLKQESLEEHLQRKMGDVIDEQRGFTEQETEEKIKDIIETYHEYYELYTRTPERLMQDYEQFQRKFRYLLKKVQNSMQIGDDFARRIKIWMEGGVVDMKMTACLCMQGEIQRSIGLAAVEQYEQEMANIISYVNYSAVLPPNMDEIFTLALSFNDQLREVGNAIAGAMLDSPPPPSAPKAQLDGKVNVTSPTRPECASAETWNLTKSDDWAKCGAKPKRQHSQLSSCRNNIRKREQKELIDAEEEHERILAEDINNDLQRFEDEIEHRTSEEDDLLFNDPLEHERCLQDKRERSHPSHASIIQADHGERSPVKIKTCRRAQKKLNSGGVVLEQIYDDGQMNLTDDYQELRRDQRDSEKHLQSKMAHLKAEQNKLTALEKEKKLNDLTKAFRRYRQMYCNNTGILTAETIEFQGKFMLQLTRLQNSVQNVVKFMPSP